MKYQRYNRLSELMMSDAAKAAVRKSASDRTPHLPADKMYKVDPNYTRHPFALCENCFLGLPACSKGVGRECFCRIPCAQQYALTATDFGGPYATPEAERLAKEAVKSAKRHARKIMEMQRPEMEITEQEIDEMVAWIMEGVE